MVLFGLNSNFFRFTSLPFTEALAFTLAFGLLLALAKAVESPARAGWACAAGVVAGLGYLARTQFLGLTLVGPLVFLGLVAGGRREYGRMAVISGGAAAVFVAGWAAYLFAAAAHPSLRMILDSTASQETPELGVFELLVSDPSLVGLVRDRLEGVLVSLSPFSSFSYVRSFGPAALLAPIALGVSLWRFRPWAHIRRMLEPDAAPIVATLLAGAACLLPIHLAHMSRAGGWMFQFRQGLPFILLELVAVPYLWAHSRWLRRTVLLLMVGSLAMIGPQLVAVFHESYGGMSPAHVALQQWLVQHGDPVVMSVRANTLAAQTGGRVHGVYCDEPGSQTRTSICWGWRTS